MLIKAEISKVKFGSVVFKESSVRNKIAKAMQKINTLFCCLYLKYFLLKSTPSNSFISSLLKRCRKFKTT
jgi:hypothetical protein